MKFLKFGILVLVVCPFATGTIGEACDSSGDVAPCDDKELCWNGSCIGETYCKNGAACSGTPGSFCVSDYCHPLSCNSTGQCVTGHVCSQNTNRACVYPVNSFEKEGAEFELAFRDPLKDKAYSETKWLKGDTESVSRIVLNSSVVNVAYFGEYCSNGASSCPSSDKGTLDILTGNLIIKKIELTDDDYYYYSYQYGSGLGSGIEYEHKLNVYVKPTESSIQISGVPEGIVGEGTVLDLTCHVDRIKPKSSLFWTINGERKNVTTTDTENADGTYKQATDVYKHTVTREDETICCSVEKRPGYWEESISKSVTVNPGYGPSGSPSVSPRSVEKYADAIVILTCTKPADDDQDGNPECDKFNWTRREGNLDDFVNDEKYGFKMDKNHTGNYTCVCGNQFGYSGESNIVDVVMLEGVPPPTQSPQDGSTGGVDAAIIGGAVGGAVVLIVLVVVIVIFILRRRNKPKSIPDDENRMVHKNGSAKQPEEPTYAQPDKTRKLRPHRGIKNDGRGIDGPQYMNTKEIQGEGENPYENTQIDNNNPPAGKQENGITPEVVYTEVKIGENGVRPVIPGRPGTKPKPKPKPTERTSVKKPKINQNEEPTVYAEIKPQPLVKKDEEN